MSDKYKIISVKPSDESIIRKEEDNTILDYFYQESNKRNQVDTLIINKLAQESATRVEEDCKLSIRYFK